MTKKELLERLEALEERTREPETVRIEVRFIAQAPGLEPGDWSETIQTGGFHIDVPVPPKDWKKRRRRED